MSSKKGVSSWKFGLLPFKKDAQKAVESMKGGSGAIVSVLGRQVMRPHVVESTVQEDGCEV